MNFELLQKNKQLKIAVIGGGNIGTQFACICAAKGCCVNFHSSKPEQVSSLLEIVNEKNEVISGEINLVTSDMGTAVENCQIVFVTHPAFQLKETASKIRPFVHPEMSICVVPGTGGAEFAFQECIQAGAKLYGLQRVPAVARLEQYGKRVRVEGLRDKLHVGAIPNGGAEPFAMFLSDIFGIPCEVLPNYLSVTLTPSNPILHTTRLKTLFETYTAGTVYPENPRFYGEWSDKSSALLFACDEELQQICKLLKGLDLTNVRSLKLHYESETVEALTRKICSIRSLNSLYSPMIKSGDGWIPDFQSRYFTADFPFGLAIIDSLADLVGYKADNVRQTLLWYQTVTGDMTRLNFHDYGIYNLDDLYAVYNA